MGDRPSDEATLERANRIANNVMFTLALQRRRLQSIEPEDGVFIFRPWADLEFFILALRRLRRAAKIAENFPVSKVAIETAISEYDTALPGLNEMRNVLEHLDQYVMDDPKRHHQSIGRGQLEASSWDGITYRWLGHELNVDFALEAANRLLSTIKKTLRENAAAQVARKPEA